MNNLNISEKQTVRCNEIIFLESRKWSKKKQNLFYLFNIKLLEFIKIVDTD